MTDKIEQIKAIAIKMTSRIANDIRDEIDAFKKSKAYREAYKEFCANDERVKSLDLFVETATELYALNPRFKGMQVNLSKKLTCNSGWDNYLVYINMPTDTAFIEDVKQKLFQDSLVMTGTYKPVQYNAIYNDLQYATITNTNLLEIEELVRKSYLNSEGFTYELNTITDD